MKRKLFLFFLALAATLCIAFALPACVSSEKSNAPFIGSDGLEYTISDDGTYCIVSGMGTNFQTDIIIPSICNNLC